VFARKVDAQRFLTEMENAKLRGTWTHPALGRVLFGEWFTEWRRTTASLRPNTEARDERLFGCICCPASARCRWPGLASARFVAG
jgi:hypothetical protein